jgi:transcriptional regulator with XRE-family HTH domain
MNNKDLQIARRGRGWSQKEAAAKLRLSQPYLSQLETGKREVPDHVARRALRVFDMSATWLPVKEQVKRLRPAAGDTLAHLLAALGYPGFGYLKPTRPKNPAEVLLKALAARDLDGRLAEALPWLPLNYPDLDWQWLADEAKKHELQNRLGYVINVARKVAERRGEDNKATKLRQQEVRLESARLFREDTLCQESMTEAEKRWLQNNRPPEAVHWRVFTDLLPEHLSYAK